MNYKEMLLLSYFKCHYKKYEFNEIIQLLGITFEELNQMIDILIEKRMLLIYKEHIILSKMAEDILIEQKIPLVSKQIMKSNGKEGINVEEIYIPENFKL